MFRKILQIGFQSMLAVLLLLGLLFTSSSTVQASSCAYTHTISAGEYLYSISLIYGVNWTEIAAANGIGYPYTIYAGQTLCIPSGGTYSGSSSSNGEISVAVSSIVKDKTVAFKGYNLPENEKFDVLMGTCTNLAKNGTSVGSIKTDGVAGTYSLTVKIPSNLKGKSCLALRLDSIKTDRVTYTTFTNGTGSGGATGGATSTVKKTVPTVRIVEVKRNSTVKATFGSLVVGYTYKIYIGGQGADGTGGRQVDTFVPSYTSATIKYIIPSTYHGAEGLTVRIVCVENDKKSYATFANANLP
jgi:LysM repeat protein